MFYHMILLFAQGNKLAGDKETADDNTALSATAIILPATMSNGGELVEVGSSRGGWMRFDDFDSSFLTYI